MADELEINKGGVVSLIDNHELGEILKPLVEKFICLIPMWRERHIWKDPERFG